MTVCPCLAFFDLFFIFFSSIFCRRLSIVSRFFSLNTSTSPASLYIFSRVRSIFPSSAPPPFPLRLLSLMLLYTIQRDKVWTGRLLFVASSPLILSLLRILCFSISPGEELFALAPYFENFFRTSSIRPILLFLSSTPSLFR